MGTRPFNFSLQPPELQADVKHYYTAKFIYYFIYIYRTLLSNIYHVVNITFEIVQKEIFYKNFLKIFFL